MATTRTQFFQQKPANQKLYTTLEIYHPDQTLLRYVAGEYAAVSFTLESDAPRNPSQVVSFEPVAFEAPEPEQGQFGASLDVQLGLAGLEVKEYLNSLTDTGRRTPIEIIRRQHLDGVTEPFGIYRFEVSAIALKARQAAIQAEQVNAGGRDVSRRYKTDEFIGLGVSI